MAAGRRVSSEAIRIFLPCRSLSRLAILAVVVVLPEPCRPTIRMVTGAGALRSMPICVSPSTRTSSSWTILTTCWPGVTDLVTSAPTARSRTCSTKARDHFQRHVGFEQRAANLAQRRVDVGLAQRATAAQAVEDFTQAIA